MQCAVSTLSAGSLQTGFPDHELTADALKTRIEFAMTHHANFSQSDRRLLQVQGMGLMFCIAAYALW
jgi:hypothetical protein